MESNWTVLSDDRQMIDELENKFSMLLDEHKKLKTHTQELCENMSEVMKILLKLEKDNFQLELRVKELEESKEDSCVVPSTKKTLEQNRLWRLYANNFRQNNSANSTNLGTQMSLKKHN